MAFGGQDQRILLSDIGQCIDVRTRGHQAMPPDQFIDQDERVGACLIGHVEGGDGRAEQPHQLPDGRCGVLIPALLTSLRTREQAAHEPLKHQDGGVRKPGLQLNNASGYRRPSTIARVVGE
jgi:hypothetical protein